MFGNWKKGQTNIFDMNNHRQSSPVISQLVYTMDFVICTQSGVQKTAKYVVEWYNSIDLFNKQTYVVPMNPIVITSRH